jgi:transposase
MKKYRVTLEKEERGSLQAIIQKGSHRSQKVLNALILLNCDEGEYQDCRAKNEEVAKVLKVSMRKIDRVKKRFVEDGLEVALYGRRGERAYQKKADGDLEAHLVALSCSKPPEGFSRWSLRLLADTAVELDYIDSLSYETVRRVLKKRNKTLEEERLGYSSRPRC